MFRRKEPQRVSPGQVDTIVGTGCEFQGTLTAQGTIRVEGRINGEVKVQGDLIIGEKGQVTANIKARDVTVAGIIRGDLDLEGTLEITSSGQVQGDIAVANLIIGEGANFQGNCKMQQPAEDKGQKMPGRAAGETKVKA
ncbi:MAG: polymer-forming cytoskeletal protein [Firmicutes bacterium]|nr:polymer-forming cytoskeletal protein [Bacillota bacterium]